MGPERPEVLRPRHRCQGQSSASAGPSGPSGPLEGIGHHAGGGDGRHGVDGDAGRRQAAQLPGQGGHGPLGTAVGAGVGRPPPRAGGHAQHPAVTGRRHQRKSSAEDVEIAPQVDAQHGQPVLLGPPAEVGLAGDAGHVDDRIQSTVVLDQFAEEAVDRLPVGDRHRRGPGRPTGRHDAAGRGLLRLREPLGAVQGHQGVDGDDMPSGPAELFGDGRPDATPAAGDDRHPLPTAHDDGDRTVSSRPSKTPASSHSSSNCR